MSPTTTQVPKVVKANWPSGYKLLRTANGRGAQISVPRMFVDVIPEGAVFDAELTEEGLLYRFRRAGDLPVPDLPSWTKEG